MKLVAIGGEPMDTPCTPTRGAVRRVYWDQRCALPAFATLLARLTRGTRRAAQSLARQADGRAIVASGYWEN
jgi:hypothetical protein